MDKTKREERISAYLDGELNAAEAKRTEQWIAEDPRAKKLFDELKRLQDAIHQLPRHQLQNDLIQPVLDQIVDQSAVRASLSLQAFHDDPYVAQARAIEWEGRDSNTSAVDPPEMSKIISSLPEASTAPQSESRRIFLWPALALAAAVMLMIFSQPDSPEKKQPVVRIDERFSTESALPQPTFAKSLDDSIAVDEAARRDRNVFKNRGSKQETDRAAGDILTPDKTRVGQKNRAEKRTSKLAVRQSGRTASGDKKVLNTYIYRAKRSLNLTSKLKEVTGGIPEIRLVDLGVSHNGTVNYHVFDLHGDSQAIGKAIAAVKNLPGISFAYRANIREGEFQKKNLSAHGSPEQFDPLEKEAAMIEPAKGVIRVLFITAAT